MPVTQLQYLSDELNKLREQKLYQKLRILETEQRAVARFDGREVINLSSNNYLGLTTHPKLKQKALEAVEKYGVGSGAVRTIAGTMSLHMALEEKIARFKNVEASVVFQSGFTANAGTVQAILSKEDVIISDELNHASIIDGCRLSRAQIKVFPHKDVEACEKVLQEIANHPGRKLLITDGVFSMDGDIAPLPQLVELAEKYGCIMMIDDAHASGVLGRLLNARHHRVSLPPRQALPVLNLAPAFRRRQLHRSVRGDGRGAAASREALGEYEVLQGRPEEARVRYRRERDADHSGYCRRCGAGARVLPPVVRRGRLRAEPRFSHCARGQSTHPHHRHRHAHRRGTGAGAGDPGIGGQEAQDHLAALSSASLWLTCSSTV
jgi:hypothetical protein